MRPSQLTPGMPVRMHVPFPGHTVVMNQALADPPGTQTYIKELGKNKVEPNPKKVTSFPFTRACVLVQLLPVCPHPGIEAYTYTSEDGEE